MKLKEMTNIKDLRDNLITQYGDLATGKIDFAVAKELSNTAGKILGTCKVELEYNKNLGIKEEIEFLAVNKQKENM